MTKVKDSEEYINLYQKMLEKYKEGKDLIKYGKIGTAIVAGASLYELYEHHIGSAIAMGAGAATIGGLLGLVNKKVKNLGVMIDLMSEPSFTNLESKEKLNGQENALLN